MKSTLQTEGGVGAGQTPVNGQEAGKALTSLRVELTEAEVAVRRVGTEDAAWNEGEAGDTGAVDEVELIGAL